MSCSKRGISIASEYDYKQLPKAQNSVCGLQFWQIVLPLKQVQELGPDELIELAAEYMPPTDHRSQWIGQQTAIIVDLTEDTLCMVLPYWMAVSTVYIAER